MHYYLIAGERSGDLHGANLIRAIRGQDANAAFRAYGGEQMQAAGAVLVRHYAQMAFMGFWTVAKNLGTIRRIMRECQADLLAHRPDALVLIDYSGFNLRIATFAHQHGIRVFYYIAPKVWAWNPGRAKKIRASVDRLFTILPFETRFFENYGIRVDYVGNPLLDALADFRPNPNLSARLQSAGKPIVALLPGSREQEVRAMLPVMLAASRHFPAYTFALATVSNLPARLYQSYLIHYPDVLPVADAAYDVLSVSTAALVTSGTATLETALFNVPQVVCYKASKVFYAIGKRLLAVRFLSLVNLIADREVVKELIQDFNEKQVVAELAKILPDGSRRADVLAGYADVQARMGDAGASERAAQLMVEDLNRHV